MPSTPSGAAKLSVIVYKSEAIVSLLNQRTDALVVVQERANNCLVSQTVELDILSVQHKDSVV